MFTLREIAEIVGGRLIGDPDPIPRRVIHDSRLIREGDLFVALPGKYRDGHAFIADAFSKGARGAIVSRKVEGENLIVVGEVLAALQRLAAAWRDRLNGPIIAITGSNGKTTTKDLLAHIVAGKVRAYSSPENYNTEIGLPIALLGMKEDDRLGVFELGTTAPGEISILARILRPDGAVITGIGPSHLGSFESLEAVADEKWSLVRSIRKGSMIVVNGDSPHLRARAGKGVVTVGLEHGEIRGRIVREVPRLTVEMESPRIILDSPLLGTHNGTNLLLAAAAALRLGIPPETIAERAATFTPREHRLFPIETAFGTILDDTYNANPASSLAAIRVLDRFGDKNAKRIFVFGEMLDLGKRSAAYHREVLAEALKLRIDSIFPVGKRPVEACRSMRTDRAVFCPLEELPSRLVKELSGGENVILVKGSHALSLKRLVDELRSI